MTQHSHARRSVVLGGLTMTAALTLPLRAQTRTKIVVGYTAVSDFSSLFVAKEEGYFDQRGLDVEPQFIPLNPSIPAAIQANSLQMGGPTPSVYLQSVDGGLDHVVVAGGGVNSQSARGVGLVARKDSGIQSAADCVGKKIGVPGLGAYLHVTFRAWLKLKGVDYTKVNFIEASFPQHGDLLRGGSLDAVVTADPFMARIISSGVGYVAAHYTSELPEGVPTILYSARRDWVANHQAATRGFQEAIVEGADFVKQSGNDARVREIMGKYIKLPDEVLATIEINPPGPTITREQLTYWVETMTDQGMLKNPLDVDRLIVG